MPKDASRPSLPTSSSDFALPSSSVASTSSVTLEDASFMLQRFRRPSLLAPKASSETRLHSPLVSSFTLQPSPIKRKAYSDDEGLDHSLVYRDRTGRESSPSSSSENPTPPLGFQENSEESEDSIVKSRSLRTPPRKGSTSSIDKPKRRLSFPVQTKQPRIMNLLAESRPVENEVKSEAAFQRLVASGAELPIQPRTPRTISNRGRFPEEVGEDDYQREDTPSDDEADEEPFASYASSTSEPIAILRNRTPAGSINGDDLNIMSISESPGVSSMAMDVDVPSGSPSVSSISSTPINHWRHTPPPTSSAVRSNKRKLEDRFDPYPVTSKRRAVSPSVNFLREAHSNVGSPKTRSTPRLPIAIPVAIPGSNNNSATSSPTFSNSFSSSFPRPVPITSSPTLRASMGLASPILRPLARGIRRDGEEKEVDGAGEAVGGLSLG